MRGRIYLTLLAFVFSTLVATAVLAEDVFVTKKGKKYHKENSQYIKGREVIKMTREEAEEKGYKPSSEFLQDDNTEKEENK